VLAIVEHEEDGSMGEKGEQARHGILPLAIASERRSHRRRQVGWIRDGTEVDEANLVAEIAREFMGNRHGHRGFAHAAGANNADETLGPDQLAQGGHRLVPPDHPAEAGGKPQGLTCGSGWGPLDRRTARDGSHEAVAAARARS
jgi:hypothetical protein